MWGGGSGACGYRAKSPATFLKAWLDCFWKCSHSPTLESIPFLKKIFPIVRVLAETQKKCIPLKRCELWGKHPRTSVLGQSPVDTHWANAQAKNMYFLSSLLPFFLHVRVLLGAAGPWPYWSLNPPSCKAVGCQTSSDLQPEAHAMPLLLWAIKGK